MYNEVFNHTELNLLRIFIIRTATSFDLKYRVIKKDGFNFVSL